MEFEFSKTQTNLRAGWIDSDAVVHMNFIHWIQLHVTKTRKNEQETSTGNGKMKSGNKLRELEMKFLIGLGFKLEFVPILKIPRSFPYSFPAPRSPYQ